MHILLAFVLFGALAPVPGKPLQAGAKACAGANCNSANKQQTAPNPTILGKQTAPEVNSGADGQKRDENKNQSVTVSKFPAVSISKDWADWGVWCFSFLLVIVGGLQVHFLNQTLKAIKIQVKDAKDSAIAADVLAQGTLQAMRDQATHMYNQTLHLGSFASAAEQNAKTTQDTLTAIERQGKSMRRQTTHLKNSAEAALLNAKAAINAERPWVFASVKKQFPDMDMFTVHAENKGRTPAFILEGSVGFLLVKSFEDMPLIPPYTFDTLVRGKIVLPESSALVFGFSQKSLMKKFGSDFPRHFEEGKIFAIGRIVYRDLLTPDHKTTHETRWICWYRPGEEDAVSPVEGVGLSDEYERYT
jgi:hypothetical protein